MAAGARTGAVLLERDAELAVLSDALARARDGRGAIVVVDGPAGIGKTQLLRAAADEAAATETGTLYVLTSDTTDKQVVLAIKGTDGKLITATQKTSGDPKIDK
jgi:predicted ATP-dependent serine protease